MYGDDDLLPLSGLQHLSFCERQWALIHVEQLWSDNADTLRGDFFHERVDTAGYACVSGVRAQRTMRVVSHRLGLYGIADIVEFQGEMPLQPVEYKAGKPKVEDWDRIQLAAQVMCLEEMYDCRLSQGALFYGRTRRREVVSISDRLRQEVERLACRAHELYTRGVTPIMPSAPRCRRCSLVDLCMPAVGAEDVQMYWQSFGEDPGEMR